MSLVVSERANCFGPGSAATSGLVSAGSTKIGSTLAARYSSKRVCSARPAPKAAHTGVTLQFGYTRLYWYTNGLETWIARQLPPRARAIGKLDQVGCGERVATGEAATGLVEASTRYLRQAHQRRNKPASDFHRNAERVFLACLNPLVVLKKLAKPPGRGGQFREVALVPGFGTA